MRFSFTDRLINGNLLLTRSCEQFLLGEGEGKGSRKGF